MSEQVSAPRSGGSLAELKDLVNAAGGPAAIATAVPVEPKRDALGRSYATGRRKNAVARVWVKPGKGDRKSVV